MGFFNNSLEISKTINNPSLVSNNCKMLFKAYGIKGDYSKAYQNGITYMNINDSLDDISNSDLLSEFSGKMEAQNYDKQNLENSMNKAYSHIEHIIIVLITLCIGGAAIFGYRFYLKKKKPNLPSS
jgi:hypothetical protein